MATKATRILKPIVMNTEDTERPAKQTLYVSLKKENRTWLDDQAKAGGFKVVSKFVDALVDKLRKEELKKAS